jgi:hypothetical protein
MASGGGGLVHETRRPVATLSILPSRGRGQPDASDQLVLFVRAACGGSFRGHGGPARPRHGVVAPTSLDLGMP